MKRNFARAAASALVMSMLSASLALAQPDQQHGAPPGGVPPGHMAPGPQDQHMPDHTAPTHFASPSQHAPEQTQHVIAGPQHMAGPPIQHMSPPPQQHMAMAPSHQWRHGDHFTGDRRVVTNWQYYHANPPPAGYEWVQDGSELVLISIASGVIADVLANAVYQ
jgi:Ni/Co efflux regulator RcnB